MATMYGPRGRQFFRVIKFVAFILFIAISEAHAANPEETAKVWGLAIFTIVGGGWFWRRTFKAADIYEVWYGTNRKEKILNTFDNDFGTKLHFGKCKVSIPKGHKFGSIGSSPLKRWLQRLVSGTDDKLDLLRLTPLSADDFEKGINLHLAKHDATERIVLIFIHGYNVKFRDAAIRAAQIGFDLKIPGAMTLFSWPSKADLHGYIADADSIAASETFLVDFINRVSKAAGNAKVNIIAHSMGNLGLIRALAHGYADGRLRDLRFGQIFLAAPDIDVNLFKQLAKVYRLCSERTTLYISAGDRALSASRLVHFNQRTGYAPPVTIVAGIDTVETSQIDVGFLGHGYYAAAAPVLYDMATLVRHNTSPNKRGLTSAKTVEGEYWLIQSQT
jgi:esterase/lipase superfamily enzyme